MAMGYIGLFTGAAEALATAIGAGMLLGSFGAGTIALVAGRSRRSLERRVLIDGYYGGIFGTLLVVFDLIARYGG